MRKSSSYQWGISVHYTNIKDACYVLHIKMFIVLCKGVKDALLWIVINSTQRERK